jgi:hypothetical protein
MDVRYDLRFSLEEVAAQVDVVEEFVGEGDVPLSSIKAVDSLQSALGFRVAFAASRLMTGMRWHDERHEYLDAYAVYRRLLGAIALDAANRTYDKSGDYLEVIQGVDAFIRGSKNKIVEDDFRLRLQGSPVERFKQSVAQDPKARFAIPFALTTGAGAAGVFATTAFLHSDEAASWASINITPTQSGIVAAATVAGGLIARSAVRSGSKRVGTVLGNQANMSFLTYMLDELDGEENENASRELEYLIGRYAVRHLQAHSERLSRALLDCSVKTKDDIPLMVKKALDASEAATHRSYGVDPDNEWPGPWYLRIPSKALRINLANYN